MVPALGSVGTDWLALLSGSQYVHSSSHIVCPAPSKGACSQSLWVQGLGCRVPSGPGPAPCQPISPRPVLFATIPQLPILLDP